MALSLTIEFKDQFGGRGIFNYQFTAKRRKRYRLSQKIQFFRK
jgi:hypothetical protein